MEPIKKQLDSIKSSITFEENAIANIN